MLKIKITSYKNIKPIKFVFNGWMDYHLSNIYRLIPDCDSLTLWINDQNCGTFSAVTLINYLGETCLMIKQWQVAICYLQSAISYCYLLLGLLLALLLCYCYLLFY